MSLYDYYANVAVQPSAALVNEVRAGEVGDRRASMKRRSIMSQRAFLTMGIKEIITETYLDTLSNLTVEAKRYFCQSVENNSYTAVGWILHEGITNCMICRTHFTPVQGKYNCAACGIVVCNSCSSKSVFIHELADFVKHRVCSNCFDGSEYVYAVEKYNAAPKGTFGDRVVSSARMDDASSVITANGAPDGPLQHLTFLKSLTHKPISEVKAAYQKAKEEGRAIVRRKSYINKAVQDVYKVTHLEEEEIYVDKALETKRTIYRVYVQSNNGGAYSDVGWVVMEGVSNCMNCKLGFGGIYSKYHCKACGDIVCSTCANQSSSIEELGVSTKQRVCVTCYQGDEAIHIRSKKPKEPVANDEVAPAEPEPEVITEQTSTAAPFCYCFAY